MTAQDPIQDPRPLDPTPQPNGSAFEQAADPRGLLVVVLRTTFLVLVVGTVALTLASSRTAYGSYNATAIIGTFMATLGAAVLVVIADVMTPRKRLPSLLGIYVGVSFGLVAALGFAALVDIVVAAWQITGQETLVFFNLAKSIVGLSLVYLSVSIVLSTKDDFRLIIPYVQFERRAQGVLPLLLDTSALIDGRLVDLARTGFIDAPIVITRFVIDELQRLADSSDKLKRERGRHGLDVLSKLQEVYPDTRIETDEVAAVDEGEVDRALIETARREGYRLITTDAALAKIAKIQSVAVLNINDVAGSLRLNLFPGDELEVEIVRKGDAESQGVGYLPDGTMLIIDNAADQVGESIQVCITNTLQRAGGKLVFGRLAEAGPGPGDSQATEEETEADMARAATTQPRSTDRPEHPATGSALRKQRNPRRRK